MAEGLGWLWSLFADFGLLFATFGLLLVTLHLFATFTLLLATLHLLAGSTPLLATPPPLHASATPKNPTNFKKKLELMYIF